MKASESNAHYASRVRECSNFAVREIKKVCKDIGPRPTGGEAEKSAQDYVENVMKNFSDEVRQEEFTCAPKAYQSRGTVFGIMMIISAALTILALATEMLGVLAIAAAAISCLATFILLYPSVFEFLYPKAKSSNVICTRKASGETKRRIVVGGYVDSGYEERYGSTMKYIVATAPIVSIAIDIFAFANMPKAVNIALIVVQALLLLVPLVTITWYNKKVCSLGANSDLTGVFASMGALKYLNDNDIRFENTEVCAVSLGSGEAGHTGAKAFAKNNDGVETFFISVDTLNDFDRLALNPKLDTETLKTASERAEISLSELSVATDAGAMQKNGVKSASLTAFDPSADFYHTSDDVPEKLDMKCMEAGIKIILEAVFSFDEK